MTAYTCKACAALVLNLQDEPPPESRLCRVCRQEDELPGSIRCPHCNLVSHNPHDIRHRFCALCGFHDSPRKTAI